MRKCVYCSSGSVVRNGVRKNRCGWKRFYKCRSCARQFTPDEGFNRFRHKPEVITAALDLRAKGLSLADVVDHLDQHHRIKVTRKTILDWQNHFSKKIKKRVEFLNLLGTDYHADEVYIKVRKEWKYYGDCLEYKTKFLVADHISHELHFEEAKSFLKKVKDRSEKKKLINSSGL